MLKFLVVGAGVSGAVLARKLVESLNCEVVIIDERQHLAGNCHTEREDASGIMIHQYGPHIFNTNRDDVWGFVCRYAEFAPYTNRVKAVYQGHVYSLPINLMTINNFFGKCFNPQEAAEFLQQIGDSSIESPENFEEQALKMLGSELYNAFFYGYTKKQWGCEPKELPATILKRLPVRFNYDDNYYAAKFQGIPIAGYTAMVEKLVTHPRIEVNLGTAFARNDSLSYSHVFYSGPLDRYFDYSLGRLGYRTVLFDRIQEQGDYQGNAVINYCDESVPYTRIHEHKHFTPWESHKQTVAFKEFSKETELADVPYYPKRLAQDMGRLADYVELASGTDSVSYIGRLGTYRYLNMDQAIGAALDFADIVSSAIQSKTRIPVFSSSPL